jgi:hypothetical protein
MRVQDREIEGGVVPIPLAAVPKKPGLSQCSRREKESKRCSQEQKEWKAKSSGVLKMRGKHTLLLLLLVLLRHDVCIGRWTFNSGGNL